MSKAVLEVENIEKKFGGVRAINKVSFSLAAGRVLGLIGPNGAGKTTIFNIINGIYLADKGAVTFASRNITGMRPAAIARLGIARTFQVPKTFNDMTVAENLQVALLRAGLDRQDAQAEIDGLLEKVRLTGWADRPASELAAGQRKLLELARAMLQKPTLFLLDEPFSGASADVVELTLDIIKELTRQGAACLVISHDIITMPRLCEDVIVLVGGAVMKRGKLEAIRRDPAVIEAYLGN